MSAAPAKRSDDVAAGIAGGPGAPSVAFVGAGPTTIYTLQALVEHAKPPLAITIFEEQSSAGRGTPYRAGWNDPAMLSNIASIEIPPLGETLVDWLRRQPAERLAARGVEPDAIDERAFYPRLLIGDYLQDGFRGAVAQAEARGIAVDIRTRADVIDMAARDDGVTLAVRPRRGPATTERFDRVVIATGHEWPDEPEVRPGYFLSPWPASALADVPAVGVGIRGTSLSAIDAVVALALANGAFEPDDGDGLRYVPAVGRGALHMTMMSRKGLLPEADFYHPIPYEPLAICTPEAIAALIDAGSDGLLDRTFDLFRGELIAADPAYAARTGIADRGVDDFCEDYFAERADTDPFEWAAVNLAEAEANAAKEVTVAWRYAILRMHEVIEPIVPHLDDADFDRFSKSFKPIFVDDYATVPHESIRRLLALHAAGALDILAIGDDYRIDSHGPERGAVLLLDGERRHYPVFIEATGQRPLAAKDFPFPSLLRQGLVRDVEVTDDEKARVRGIDVDDDFHPTGCGPAGRRIHFLSLPFLMGRHPFVQGITSSHEMGTRVGIELAASITSDAAADGEERTSA